MVIEKVKQIQDLDEEKYGEWIISLTWDIGYNIEVVNLELLGSRTVSFCDLSDLGKDILDYKNKDEAVRQYSLWLDNTLKILEKRCRAEDVLDESFMKLMDYVSVAETDAIIEKV